MSMNWLLGLRASRTHRASTDAKIVGVVGCATHVQGGDDSHVSLRMVLPCVAHVGSLSSHPGVRRERRSKPDHLRTDPRIRRTSASDTLPRGVAASQGMR